LINNEYEEIINSICFDHRLYEREREKQRERERERERDIPLWVISLQ
jgi:hypothetical protein